MKLPEDMPIGKFTDRIGVASRIAASVLFVSASIGGVYAADRAYDSTILAGMSNEIATASSQHDRFIGTLSPACQDMTRSLNTTTLDLSQTTAILKASDRCGPDSAAVAAETHKLKAAVVEAKGLYQSADIAGHFFGILGAGALIITAVRGGVKTGKKIEDSAYTHLSEQRYGDSEPSIIPYSRFSVR